MTTAPIHVNEEALAANQRELAAAVKGYRSLSATEVALINELKSKGDELGALLATVQAVPGVDSRALAIARTELQTGLMWAVRAIAQPTTF